MYNKDVLRTVLATFVGEDTTFDDMIEELLSDNPTQSVMNAPGQRRTTKETSTTNSIVLIRSQGA